MVWRNVIVSKKNQRIICIDRYLSEGRTKGYVYVLQSETKRFPTLGLYHWDVSDGVHGGPLYPAKPSFYGSEEDDGHTQR